MLLEQVESLVDQHGVQKLLDALSDVCHLKAQHIATEYQFDGLARQWRLIGVKVHQLANKSKFVK